ncbi:AAA family ATPase [Rheinheimera texasensis]|uniref:ATP-dependent nuclease n=1 Tax=Rheinheimera texasensis TaxID=306205 RepID=UPI0032B2A242
MAHHISKLQILNYKSCKNLLIDLTPYTPMVGYNNAGKSNILSALEWLLDDKLLPPSDYNDPNLDISIEGIVNGVTEEVLQRLSDEHREPLRPFIGDGIVRIKRTQPANAAKKADVRLEIYNFVQDSFQKNPRGIWNAIKALFPDPIKIGAMENAADDASKAKSTSTIGKLLKEISVSIQQAQTLRISRHLDAISRRIDADGSKRIQELNYIDRQINNTLVNYFPGVNIKLHFEMPNLEELLNSGTVKVYEQNQTGREISSYGHGTQRSVQMALIQYLSEIKQNNESITTTLLLIDEPELYLHPFAIEQVREALHSLSESGYQIVFTTHSAQMITEDRAQHTLLIRKNNQDGTHSRKRLNDAISQVVPDAISQANHLFSLSQSTKILFANEVILTEGKTELRLLPFIYQKVKNKTLGQNNTALIETGSVDNIGKTIQILREMDLPTKAIVDMDYLFKGAIHSRIVSADNPDLVALRTILNELKDQGVIQMKGDTPGAKHCEALVKDARSIIHINNLHQLLKAQNIWVWQKGSIESHLGLRGKNEGEWAGFKNRINMVGNDINSVCADPISVNDLIAWL